MADEEYEKAAIQYRRALMSEPRNTKLIWGLARALNKAGLEITESREKLFLGLLQRINLTERLLPLCPFPVVE